MICKWRQEIEKQVISRDKVDFSKTKKLNEEARLTLSILSYTRKIFISMKVLCNLH